MTRMLALALIVGLVAACTTESKPTTSSSAVTARSLDPHERNRLNSAIARAFAGADGIAVAYTIEPLDIEAEPTVVQAKPVAPATDRAGGTSCRPLEITIIKNGRTSKSTTAFCRRSGSKDIAPES
jgi:hypothetical protein